MTLSFGRYLGIFSAAVSILTGQVVEKCMRLAEEFKQFELESFSPFVLVNDPEHERRISFHCAMKIRGLISSIKNRLPLAPVTPEDLSKTNTAEDSTIIF